MKHILLLLLVCLASCNREAGNEFQYTPTPVKLYWSTSELDSLQVIELKEGPTTSDLLLGLRFGMSEDEYTLIMDSLINEKVLYQFGPNTYALVFEEIKCDATFYPEFVDDRLRVLKLVFWNAEPELSTDKIEKHFAKQYGKFKNAAFHKSFIKGNLEIKITEETVKTIDNLSPMEHTVVRYIDHS